MPVWWPGESPVCAKLQVSVLQILQLLYDDDFVLEECFLEWAEEKQAGDEEEKRFLRLAAPFIEWLKNADEESDEDDAEDDDD